MKLIDICNKYDLSGKAYNYLVKETKKSNGKGMYFDVMRNWITYKYFIFKNLNVIDIKFSKNT